MGDKVILVLCDGLRDDAAAEYMGYLEHLVEARHATRYTVIAELPTMSRPIYETLHTGAMASVHGITSNFIVRRSKMPNIFELARDAGLVTAASAFYWFSELYNRAPYDMVLDREIDDPTLPIQHGRFYREENPDVETFLAGAMLIGKYKPDYLLIHPMMLDVIGEKHGGISPEYRRAVIAQDAIMANLLPSVLDAGYTVLVTGDHGMSDDCSAHGGTLAQHRQVPLYIIKPGQGRGNTRETVAQLQIAPTLCRLLGLPTPPTMTALAIAF